MIIIETKFGYLYSAYGIEFSGKNSP